MKNVKLLSIKALICCLVALLFASCAGNGNNDNKTVSTDTTAKGAMPIMSAKERLAKNNILERHNSWASMKLLGKVKAFTETTYELSDNGKKAMQGKRIDSFDVNGNLIAMCHYMHDGKLDSKEIARFDGNNNNIGGDEYGENGVMVGKDINIYDSRGNEIENCTYDKEGKLIDKGTYKYDDKDNLIELNFEVGNARHFMNKCNYTYDENGFVKAGQAYDTTGKPTTKQARKYDDKGDELEAIGYKMDGSIEFKYLFKYDDKGNRTGMEEYKGNDSLVSKETMKYDDKGRVIEKVVYGPDGHIVSGASCSYEYQYDSTGNILKETNYRMDNGKREDIAVVETEYTYY